MAQRTGVLANSVDRTEVYRDFLIVLFLLQRHLAGKLLDPLPRVRTAMLLLNVREKTQALHSYRFGASIHPDRLLNVGVGAFACILKSSIHIYAYLRTKIQNKNELCNNSLNYFFRKN